MSGDDGGPVRVEIFGEEYTIRSEVDEEHTRACARHVDEAIREAHLQSHVSEPHKAAILAALEITDELLRTRAERDELREGVEARLRSLRREVESALEE
mgnify:CR=1 FL=1